MGSCATGQCGSGNGSSCDVDEQDVLLEKQLKRIKSKLLVMSGKGGVGKSSVATYLALGLARLGYKVGLLDVDLHGPSIPRMLGIHGMFDMNSDRSKLVPHLYGKNLQVVSIDCLLEDRDSAVIWRGPVKHGVIKQFVAEVEWGDLDYLVIDSPPGTGDEPLSIAQTLKGVQAVIVTTPQEVALADVRKSIDFCRKVEMPIVGVVENMSGLFCPHCNQEVSLFGRDGGRKMSEHMRVPFLGSLPFEPSVVQTGDSGTPLGEEGTSVPFLKALGKIVAEVVRVTTEQTVSKVREDAAGGGKEAVLSQEHFKSFKVAIPVANDVLTSHFGHCEKFSIVEVENGAIVRKEWVVPPPHEPGLLPRWLGQMQVSLVIAGGMGSRAQELFRAQNIQVITGAPCLKPEELIEQYVSRSLVTGPNACDH